MTEIRKDVIKEDASNEAASNFIHNIIDKDLETQKYGDKVHTRFPPEPN